MYAAAGGWAEERADLDGWGFLPSMEVHAPLWLWEVDSGGGEGALPLRVPSPFLLEAPWDPAWPLGPALVLSPAGLAQSRVRGVAGWHQLSQPLHC